jgi:hypothetical protein
MQPINSHISNEYFFNFFGYFRNWTASTLYIKNFVTIKKGLPKFRGDLLPNGDHPPASADPMDSKSLGVAVVGYSPSSSSLEKKIFL